MERQALRIAGWGDNVYVKIPVANTAARGGHTRASTADRGVEVSVTAIMTLEQVRGIASLNPDVPACVSVFAGRIADTGIDPVPVMLASIELASMEPEAENRLGEPARIAQRHRGGRHRLPVHHRHQHILKKLSLLGYDLGDYSLDTVKMFRGDAVSAGYTL